jgi:hypothetical protein
MFWFGLGVLAILLMYGFVRARAVGPLFSDDHLAELASKVAHLKAQALAAPADSPASMTTALMSVAYTVRLDADGDGAWVHHLSLSTPVTPARAAGTFFLGLLRGLLELSGPRADAFVTQAHVFHLVVRLSPEQHETFKTNSVDVPDAAGLRAFAIEGRGVLLPVLKERQVPAQLSEAKASGP